MLRIANLSGLFRHHVRVVTRCYILALSDEEKLAVRAGNARAREILEKTDALPGDQIMKMHGALRGLQQVAGKG